MKIASRNVNGIRAVIQKGFFDWIKENDFDIICLQEVKAFGNQIPPEIRFNLANYDYLRHHGTRPGYAGTAIFFKKNISIIEKKSDFPFPEFSDEGRVTEIDFSHNNQNINLINVYFPNGGTRADGTEMLSYKLDFYEKMRQYFQSIRNTGNQVICCGDYNICHTEIDIARPKENENSIGFLPIERAEIDRLAQDGMIDSFRALHPGLQNQYTWWSYRGGARANNVGRRLDYFRISPDIFPNIQNISHQTNVTGSDHCPIVLELK